MDDRTESERDCERRKLTKTFKTQEAVGGYVLYYSCLAFMSYGHHCYCIFELLNKIYKFLVRTVESETAEKEADALSIWDNLSSRRIFCFV